jgi:hypothetical protein
LVVMGSSRTLSYGTCGGGHAINKERPVFSGLFLFLPSNQEYRTWRTLKLVLCPRFAVKHGNGFVD